MITGGSGIALGLPVYFQRTGRLAPNTSGTAWPAVGGRAAVIAGSCSAATNAQVAHWLDTRPGFRINVHKLLAGADVVNEALHWAQQQSQPALIYASSPPEEVRAIQKLSNAAAAGVKIETALAEIAAGLAATGTQRLVIAGGETSGAVVQRLGIRTLRIGPAIDPGVPWTRAASGMALALKSGNFGSVDFFEKALSILP